MGDGKTHIAKWIDYFLLLSLSLKTLKRTLEKRNRRVFQSLKPPKAAT